MGSTRSGTHHLTAGREIVTTLVISALSFGPAIAVAALVLR